MSVLRTVNRPCHQRGAALVVGLIMLLLLTLIGVAGMKDTLLQEKMAGNARDREIALQAAESALRAAEVRLGALTPPAMGAAGLYDVTLSTDTQRTADEVAFWSQWGWDAADSVAYPRTLAGVAENNPPRYVIEKLDVSLSSRSGYPGGSSSTAVTAEDDFTIVASADVSDYRVTARGVGSTLDAVVILQSTFRRDSE